MRWIMPVPPEDAPPVTFGEVIQTERERRGWNQEDVAARIGIRQSKVSEYERNKAEPSWDRVAALEDCFELDRGELAALVYGDRLREQFRRMFGRSTTYVIAESAPDDVHELLNDIGAMAPEDIGLAKDVVHQIREGTYERRPMTAPRLGDRSSTPDTPPPELPHRPDNV